jgi:D-alanine-D-alanine ligase
MAEKLRVGVIFGGQSAEHEVSVKSAKNILDVLDQKKYDIVPIGITQEGHWLLVEDVVKVIKVLEKNKKATFHDVFTAKNAKMASLPTKVLANLEQAVDIVFPVLHGTYGEDGTIQGLLELVNVPYVGCGVMASAIAMDKAATKAVLTAHKIPVVDYQLVLRSQWETAPEKVISRIEEEYRYPCFVKPANAGSSIGVTKARSREELMEALQLAASYDRRILAEEAIEGREIEVAVLGNAEPVASIPGEVISSHDFYDYEAKYTDGGASIQIPADLSPRIVEKIREMAVQAYQAVDCAGMARVDFFVTRSNKIYVNEINTIPGFTSHSMYPMLWEQSGLSKEILIDRLITLGLEKHHEKTKSKNKE